MTDENPEGENQRTYDDDRHVCDGKAD